MKAHLLILVMVVLGGRGCGLVRLADRRGGGRLGSADVVACRRRRHRGHRRGCLMQDLLLLRGQQELLHQGGRVVRMRVVVDGVGDVRCRGGDEDAAAVPGALVVNDGFAAH